MDTYYTLAKEGESEFLEKRSRFIGFASHVSTAEEALAFVSALRKRYYDARHVCWAYRLGPEGSETRFNDDGEPSGTAGRPILGRLVSAETTDAVVAVVRYFGGVKLGPSGLIDAYRRGASEAIEAAGRHEVVQMVDLELFFDYPLMGSVMHLVKESGAEILEQQFEASCRLLVQIREGDAPALVARLEALYGVELKWREDEVS